jgi:transcriptional regulator with XRE-family HTH domain
LSGKGERRADPQQGLGFAVKRLREAARLTQAEVAERAGLSASFVGRVESGEVNPTWGNVRRLAKGLGVTLDDLATEAEDIERELSGEADSG